MVVTRKANANAHPGLAVVANQQKRRSKQQILADKASAKADAIATREAILARERELLNRIALMEDNIQREDDALQAHAARPDICHGSRPSGSSRKRPISTSSTEHMAQATMSSKKTKVSETRTHKKKAAEDDYKLEEPLEDKSEPEVDSEMNEENTSDADGERLEENNLGADSSSTMRSPPPSTVLNTENEEEGDIPTPQDANDTEVKDQDSDLESDGLLPARYDARKKGKKAPRGSFRTSVNAVRSTGNPPKSPSKKRKETSINVGSPKRIKKSHVPGGLSINWKAKVKQAGGAGPAHSSRESLTSNRPNTSSDGFISGEFDHDETEEALARVKASKNMAGRKTRVNQHSTQAGVKGSYITARKTARMGVILTPLVAGATESNAARSVRARKPRYTVADLPFPAGGGKHLQLWRKAYVPALLAWAGTQDDPFGANGQMNFEIKTIWQRVYSDVPLSNASYEVLQHVCENTLNNWRSELGKVGHGAVVKLLNAMSGTIDRAEYVSRVLANLCFVYKDPGAKSARGAFCSELIARTYAKHLQKIHNESEHYGPQVGGLALAAAAVERGLTLFKTGEDLLAGGGSVKSATRGPCFSENPWGEKARSWAVSTANLLDANWTSIISEAMTFWKRHNIDSDNDGASVAADVIDPRAAIEID